MHKPYKRMIKIFWGGGGEGVVDGEEGSSARCLKWGGEGSLRDLSKNISKQGVSKGKSCSLGEGGLKVSPPLPPLKILIIHPTPDAGYVVALAF